MTRRRYTIVIERGPKSFGAFVPDLPGCVAVANTRPAVVKLIREAVELHLEDMQTQGLPSRALGRKPSRSRSRFEPSELTQAVARLAVGINLAAE